MVGEGVTKSSYDDTLDDVSKVTAATIPKRQGLELADRAAVDFIDFYDNRANIMKDSPAPPGETGKVLMLSTDGKGVRMRHNSLREATRKKAENKDHKLKKRLTAGEKKDAKRMAQVAAVATIEPHVRTPREILGLPEVAEMNENGPCLAIKGVKIKTEKGPRPEGKRVWASLDREPEQVIIEMFKEGESRDPDHEKTWVALVDGNKTQLRIIKEQAEVIGVKVTIILDIIHVIEYLWKAAHAFFKEHDSRCEDFVSELLLQVLLGQSVQVVKAITQKATDLESSEEKLSGKKREAVEKCTSYLTKYRQYLRYDEYLALGFPIASGVIEGACRYLVKDRMDITGARWGLSGGEAVLKLRSIRISGDFEEYWRFHLKREQERNYYSKYANGQLTPLKDPDAERKERVKLRLVK